MFQTIKTLIWTIFLIFVIRAAILHAASGLTIFLSIAILYVFHGKAFDESSLTRALLIA